MGCTSSKSLTNGNIDNLNPPRSNRLEQNLTENIVIENFDSKITDYYDLSPKILGSGVNGVVRLCTHRLTGNKYALKTLSKKTIRKDKLFQLREEIKIMKKIDHPNIIRLHEYFEENLSIHLIMECCDGGELLERLHSQSGHHYNEQLASKYVRTMCGAISYCHENSIVHRDIKLENFLFENASHDADIKLIDFGLSQHFEKDKKLTNPVGTPYYVSPEVLAGKYTAKCDVWSIGVITYMLLSGTPPFYGKDESETLAAVRRGKFKFNEKLFAGVSNEAKDFITRCLTKNPEKRPSSKELLDHSWFGMTNEAIYLDCLSPDVLQRLKCFSLKSDLTKLCVEVLAHTLRYDQISDLKHEFMKVDPKQTGEISVETMRDVVKKFCEFDQDLLEHLKLDNQHRPIRYHEFIAATLSRRVITDDNIELAFEKMSNHRDYITDVDIKELLGTETKFTDVAKMLSDVGLTLGDKIYLNKFKEIMLGGPSTPIFSSPYAVHSKTFSFEVG